MIESFYEDVLCPGQQLVATAQGKQFKIYMVDQVSDVIPFLSEYSDKSTYHALGAYQDQRLGEYRSTRKKGKVIKKALADLPAAHAVKSFGFDLDVGEEDNKYDTLALAIDALTQAVESGSIPEPTWALFTGGGLQFYYVLGRKGISEQLWQALFYRLQAKLAQVFKGKIDSNVASTPHSWLRSPCTPNVKYPNHPMPEIFHQGRHVPWKQLKPFIQDVKPIASKRHKVSSVQVSNRIATSDLIEACAAMRVLAATGGEYADEPTWRSSLNIAAHTLDPTGFAQEISQGHEDYTEEDTLDKLYYVSESVSAGPHGCAKFGDPDNAKSPCHNCWAAKQGLPNPVSAARQWVRNGGSSQAEQDEEPEQTVDDTELEPEDLFFYGPNFDLNEYEWTETQMLKGMGNFYEQDGELFYSNGKSDKYVGTYLRVEPSQINESEGRSTCYVGRPQGRMYAIDTSKLGTGHSTSTALTALSFSINDGTLMSQYIQGLAFDRPPIKETEGYGWEQDFTTFFAPVGSILGPKTHPSEDMHSLGRKWTGMKGDMSQWIKLIEPYGAKDQRPYLMALLTSLGAPLLSYFQLEKGAIFSLTGTPGVGKSTSTMVASSVWGRPLESVVTYSSSPVNILKTIGVCHNLPVFMDEFTKVNSEVLKELALNISQGEGRSTLTQSRKFRLPEQWQTVLLTSGNNSFHQKLAEVPNTSGADMTRVMEIRVEESRDITVAQGDDILTSVKNCYGHAGTELIRHIATLDIDQERTYVNQLKEWIRRTDNHGGQQRFMLSIVLCCHLAHRYIKELYPEFPGDVDQMLSWMRGQITNNRDQIAQILATRLPSPDDFLADQETQSNVLSYSNTYGGFKVVSHSFRGCCYDMGGMVYIPKTMFNQWCHTHNVPVRTVVDSWVSQGRLKNLGSKKTPRYTATCPEKLVVNGKKFRPDVLCLLKQDYDEDNDSNTTPIDIKEAKRRRFAKKGQASYVD